MKQPARVFISYAHEDQNLVRRLEAHLAVLRRQGLIEPWTDQRINAGVEWQRAIAKQLASADIILLLVSAYFLASDFCYGFEMRRAIERHGRGEARVIPIILRPVDFLSTPLGNLQALPRDGKPVSTWRNEDEAWMDVVLQLRRAVESLPDKRNRKREPRALPRIEPVGTQRAIRILVLPSQAGPRFMPTAARRGEDLERRLRGSLLGGRLELLFAQVGRGDNLLSALLQYRPHILHFVGAHGAVRALASADGRPFIPAELANVFSKVDGVRCVVLDGCYAKPQADAIGKAVDAVIAISPAASDESALAFAATFYVDVVNGVPIRAAFDSAVPQGSDNPQNFRLATSRDADVAVGSEPTTRSSVIANLLIEIFSSTELRDFVRENYRAMQATTEGSVSTLHQALAVVESLERHALLDEQFFARLIGYRPARQPEIAQAARLYGIDVATERVDTRKPQATRRRQRASNESKRPNARKQPIAGPASTPVRVRLFGDSHDRRIIDRLETHLAPYVRSGELAVDVVTELPPKTAAPEIYRNLAETDVLAVIVSPPFLNSTAATREAVETLLTMSQQQKLSVVTVVANESDWRNSDFARFAVRPTSGSLSDATNRADERWREVVDALRLIAQARQTTPKGDASTPPSKRVHLVSDVFKTTGYPELTFVPPTALPGLVAELRTSGRVLVVEGPSGIGKTVAVKHALADLRTEGQNWPVELLQMKLEAHVIKARALHERPVESIDGHLIIDDFHMLSVEDRRRVANYAKAFADTATQAAKITLIGINQSGESIMESVPDLATRAHVVRLGREADERIVELIEKGEHALNVRFERRAEFALAANGSFVVAQMLCERALFGNNVIRTESAVREIGTDPSAVVPDIIKTLWPQFHAKLQQFAMLDRNSTQRGGPIVLLWHLGNSQDGSIAVADIRYQWPSLQQSLDDALAAIDQERKKRIDPEWHALLDCDPTTERLALDDPKLAFYLRFLDWVDFGLRCAVKLKRTPEGSLQFLDAADKALIDRRAVITQASTREVHMLHISDLHFSATTLWDSDTVLDRLVNDVVRLVSSGKQPDLLVITGDVAYSGKAEEYDLARKWIVETLLPAAGLTTASLVITPGNHDADRSKITRSAAALQKDLLASQKQGDVTQSLATPTDRDVLLGRHAAFVHLLDSSQAGGRTWDLPWGAVNVTVRGLRVHVAALCSSWFSSGDFDKGNLLLSLRQVNEVFQGAKGADLVIAAMHHPWSYLADFDDDSRREVQRNAAILLRGHLHEPDHVMLANPNRPAFIEIAAGATYESSQHANAYHFITVQLDEKKVRVHPRFWNKQSRDWTVDLNVFGGEWGEMNYGLP